MKLYLDGTLVVDSASGVYFTPTAPNSNSYTIGSGTAKVILDQIEIYKGTLLEQSDINNLNDLKTGKDTEFDGL